MGSDAGPRDTDGDRGSLSRRTIAWHQGPRNVRSRVSATPEGPLFKLPPSGGPAMPFCERCGNLIGPVASLAQVGMRPCRECGIHACDRCWGGAGGKCPGCGASRRVATRAPVAVAAPGAVLAPDLPGASTANRRSTRRPVVAAGLIVMAMAMVVAVAGNPFRPAGAVESAQEGPASDPPVADGASPQSSPTGIAAVDDGAPSPSAPAQVTATPDPEPTAGPTPLLRPRVPPRAAAAVSTKPPPKPTLAPGPTSAPTQGPPTPVPTPAPTTPSFPPPPTPVPTPDPTPDPTPVPIPTPIPTPESTPVPTADCRVVPNLVGLTVASARAEWADAGFTGSFTPGAGQNNKTVETQTQPPGACLPATISVTVTHS